jgi:hypothetical protein
MFLTTPKEPLRVGRPNKYMTYLGYSLVFLAGVLAGFLLQTGG